MRMRYVLAVGLLALFASSGCSSTSSSSSGATPTFTAEDVKPSIEGTWKGALVKGADSTQSTLVLTYNAASVKSQCSSRTLSEEDDSLHPACIDVTSMNLGGTLALQNVSTQLTGTLLITELTYQNRGDVSLSDASNNRLSARLEGGKLVGNAVLTTGEYTFTLTR